MGLALSTKRRRPLGEGKSQNILSNTKGREAGTAQNMEDPKGGIRGHRHHQT